MLPLLLLLTIAQAADSATPIRCCTQPKVEQVVVDVAKLADLARDHPTRLQNRLATLARRHRPHNTLPPGDRQTWDRIGEVLEGSKHRPSLEVLAELSRLSLYMALRYEGGSTLIAEASCPDGRTWLQLDLGALDGPYGACGGWGPPLQQKAPLPKAGAAR